MDYPKVALASSKSQSRISTRKIVLSLLLVVLAPGVIFWYVWWGRFQYRSWLMQGGVYFFLILILAINYLFFERDFRKQGFRLDNLRASLRYVLPVTLFFAFAILCYGFWFRQWHFDQLSKIRLYLVWGIAQQYALQNLLLARTRSVIRNTPAAILAASAVFSVLHLPSVELALCSFAGAVAWCWIFSRVPNLWTLAFSHSLLAVLLLVSTGLEFRIGRPGFRYEAYGGGVSVAGGYFGDGNPFVATLPGYDENTSSRVRIFSPSGKLIRQWCAFPDYGFSGNLAVGDLGFDPGDEVAVSPGPGPGNPRRIRIFNSDGELKSEFELPGAAVFGAYVAIGCGKIYATPGPAPDQEAVVFEYDAAGNLLREWRPGGLGFTNSVRAFPVEPQSGPDPGGQCPEWIALFGTPVSVNPSTLYLMDPEDGAIRVAAMSAPTYGLNAAPFHTSPDSPAIITAPGPLRGYGPHIRIHDVGGRELFNRVVYSDPRPCGSGVSSVDCDGDGMDEVLLGEGICRDSPATVRILDLNGKMIYRWDAYPHEKKR